MLTTGMKAPDFTLKNQHGEEVRLSDFLGKKVVLYFYPKDSTPGCTRQACAPPAVASLVMRLESVFAALSGWIVLKQSLQGRELLGCVLVFAAVILAQIPFDELKRKILSKKLK